MLVAEHRLNRDADNFRFRRAFFDRRHHALPSFFYILLIVEADFDAAHIRLMKNVRGMNFHHHRVAGVAGDTASVLLALGNDRHRHGDVITVEHLLGFDFRKGATRCHVVNK